MTVMEHKLVYQKRKALTIVIKNGDVTVKAPIGTPIERIERFVADKSAWLEKKLAEHGKRTDMLAPVLDGTHILLGGDFIEIRPTDGIKRVRLENGALSVPIKDDADVTRAVKNWFRRTAADMLAHVLEMYSLSTGLEYTSFALTNAGGKWGSCDGNGNIRLNWRLVMLDDALSGYVAVHELAHTVHHDHSAGFWAEVEKHCPDYKALRKRLKNYSVLTTLYR